MDPTTIRLACVVLALIFGAVIFMRRRRKED
jgi:phage shock protein PspC (stress-responsive transcriptional regulator)